MRTRVVFIVACLSLSACLVNSGIVTGNLSTVYVLDTVPEGQQLHIAGTTASFLDRKPFTVDDPIFEGTKDEAKQYTNADGDELEFRREYDPGTKQWWETAIIKTSDGETFELVRLEGFVGDDRARAWGLTY